MTNMLLGQMQQRLPMPKTETTETTETVTVCEATETPSATSPEKKKKQKAKRSRRVFRWFGGPVPKKPITPAKVGGDSQGDRRGKA